MGDEGVELVGGVLILVPQPGEAHAHPEGGAAHPLRPDGLVQPGVNAHVRCAHLLLSKLFNLLKKKHATQKQTYNTHSHIYVSFNSYLILTLNFKIPSSPLTIVGVTMVPLILDRTFTHV